MLAGVALLAIVAAAAGGYWVAHRGSPGASTSSIGFHRVTFARGMMRAARFAPDGRTIVYGAAWDGPPIKLYLARTDSPETTPIALPPAELLSISKNGEMAVALGFAYVGWMADGTLARTSLLGGSPREILEHVRAADWSPDGTQLAIVRRVEGYDQLEYPAGKVLYKTAGYIADIRVAPDGERVAFADHPSYADDRGDVAVADLSGHKTTLDADFASIHGVAWAPGGKEVWFCGVRGDAGFDLCASDLAGHGRVIYSSISPIELFDVAADGRVLLGNHRHERQSLALLQGFTEPRNLIVPGESSLARAVTPDGRAALVSNQLPKEYETYLVRAGQPGATRLSAGDGMGISPDGKWALVASTDAKTLLLSPLGMGPTRALPNPGGIAYEGIPAWLPDSKRVVGTGRRGSEPSRGFVIDAASGAATPFGAPGMMWTFFGVPPVSPDGKYVVLQDASGHPMRWPVDGGDPVPIPGLNAGEGPLVWTDDGKALFVAGDAVPIPISRIDLATGRRTPWLTIAPSDSAGLRIAAATITPNGKYWALSTARLLTDLYVVDGLR